MKEETVQVPLTRGMFSTINASDADRVLPLKWQAIQSHRTWYARRPFQIEGRQKLVPLHRFLVNPPPGMVVDHINRDGLDNRRENLRICSPEENHANGRVRQRNTSGFRGVYPEKTTGLWAAACKGRYLGLYDSAEEAARAYDTAALLAFGEFAALNFPDEISAVSARVGGLMRKNKSGYVGVFHTKKTGRWAASYTRDGTRVHVGYFASALEASEARERALKEFEQSVNA